MTELIAEFTGTLLLVLMGNGVVAGVSLRHSKAFHAGYMMVCLAWGLAVTVAIYAVGSVSGAHLNPAVTLALVFVEQFPAEKLMGYALAQTAGAFSGAVLVWIHYLPHWDDTKDPSLKLGVFCTSPAKRSLRNNFFSEVLATLVLVVGLLSIGANKFADGLNPLVVGALVSLIGFSLGGTTGFAINPARDLGPRIAHWLLPIDAKGGSDWAYAWVPVAGPLTGAALGAVIHLTLNHIFS